jgi:hypothetical protein
MRPSEVPDFTGFGAKIAKLWEFSDGLFISFFSASFPVLKASFYQVMAPECL